MKKFFSVLALCIFSIVLLFFAGTEHCIAQGNPSLCPDGYWQYELNVGLSAGALTNESHYMVTVGWRFNRHHFVGMGTGLQEVELYIDDQSPIDLNNGRVPFIPIMVRYDYYVPFRHHAQHSFFLGVNGGIGYFPDQTLTQKDTERWLPFGGCRFGLDFQVCRCMGLQVGIDGLLSKFGGIGASMGLRF